MKTLQNNFTTPEQSKRLLELGLPADSADCYHDLSLNRRGMLAINGVYSLDVPYNHFFSDGKHCYLPCWSVGRLIEIYFICSFQPEILIDYTIEDLIDYLVSLFESVAMDFSKLED